MITRKSTCGLCKPNKKWKKNRTKLVGLLLKTDPEDLSGNLVRAYDKKF